MLYSSPKQLCFPPVAGYTVRADFAGGALSSDFGPLLLRGIDRQIGLTERLAAAIHDHRHQSYIDHSLRDLLAQRIYQIAAGYADGIPHRLSNKGNVIAKGKLAPIVGAVSMDLTTVDVTSCPELQVGDSVMLLGSEGGVSIDAQQIAA